MGPEDRARLAGWDGSRDVAKARSPGHAVGGVALTYPEALQALTHVVFWFELLAPLALFIPFRTDRIRLLLVPAFMLMHLGFALFLGIGLFPLISLLSVIVFIPSLAWAKLPALSRGGAGLRIYYDGGCSFCLKMTRLIKMFLVLPQAVVLEAQSDAAVNSVMRTQNSWVVEDRSGDRHTRGAGLRAVVAASPIFSLLRYAWSLPLFSRAIDTGYRWVAENRPSAAQSVRFWRARRLPRGASGPVQVLAAAAIVYLLAWNVSGAVGWHRPIAPLATALQVQQHWSMFSPQPPSESGWFVMSGQLEDGRTVDLLASLRGRSSEEVSTARPSPYPAAFPSYRWNKFTSRMTTVGAPVGESFARYLCGGHGSYAPGQLQAVSVVFMHYLTMVPYEEPRPRTVVEMECASPLLTSLSREPSVDKNE